MTALLVIDPATGIAPYEQLRRQLAEQITAGALAPGAKLPTVRRLASDLGLSPNTVARTYQELEREGHIVTRGRRGTFASTPSDPSDDLDVAARNFAEAAARSGASPADALVVVTRALGLER